MVDIGRPDITRHELDAITCACLARMHHEGRTELIGREGRGVDGASADLTGCQEPARQKRSTDFSLNRTTIRLKIEKIWHRFSTFSLRSLLPRRLLGAPW